MNFEFFSPLRIIFGRGQIARLGEISAPMGSRAMIVFNGGDELPDRAQSLLAAAQVKCTRCRQRGEPAVGDVDAAADTARQEKVELVIGLGGGSAIDAAKAVAALLTNGGSALDYMEVVGRGQKITKASAPWIAIPSTAGTGAEVTRNAVIGAPERKFKASIRGEQLLPRVALVDPELGVNVPPDVTARSGMDALCQLIESYTSRGAQPMTDALALHGIPLAARSLRRAYENGADLDARQEMALAAFFSGITLTNAGLGAVHGFAAPLGANFPAPHGAICAVLLPHVMQANVAALRAESTSHPALARYAAVGRAMGTTNPVPDDEAIRFGIQRIADLVRDLNIPPLISFGVSESDIERMIPLAKKASSMRYNPVALSDDALANCLREAIHG